ncbi:hypothetical protein HG530_015669 [Fusarium avenaceum]|nr:hypothetical protein HG530_015669 [Fusarium avenaceum]
MGTTMRSAVGAAVGAAVGMVAVATTIVSVTSVSVTSIAVTAVARWTALELLILLLDIGDQVLTQLPCLFDHVGIRSTIHIITRPTRSPQNPYSSKLVTFNLFLVSAAEASFVNKLGKFLLDKLVDLGDSRF